MTRFPAPQWVPFRPKLLELSAVYFPLVGFCIALLAGVFYVMLSVFFPSTIAVVLMMAACVYATGAFHEDGWADTCDALGGGYSPAAIMRIMKDSRLGTYGVVGLVGMLAVKYLALLTLSASAVVILVVFAVGQTYSRWLALTVMWQLPYVQDQSCSKSKPLASAIKRKTLWLSCRPLLMLILLAFFVLPPSIGVAQLLGALALGYLGREFLMRKLRRALGGFTGDGLGAVQQLSEVLFYLGCVAFLSV